MNDNTAQLFRRLFKVLKPPPDLTLSEWADKYRRLAAGTTAEPGRWKTANIGGLLPGRLRNRGGGRQQKPRIRKK